MLTITDLFCGAGGSSIGAEAAGASLRMAANHWPKAIAVHQANFEHAAHDCADISQVDPRRYPRTDILLASPECTNHTSAKGVSRKSQDPTLFDSADLSAERSRATMWDVHRFVEVHRYDAVVVENVVEASRWVYWPSWWQAWDDAGYDAKVLSINSAHTGEVHQWRDRIYVVAVRRGMAKVDLSFSPPSWCNECEGVVAGYQSWRPIDRRSMGKWRQQYDYRCPECHSVVAPPAPPAEDIIDWTLPALRIGDRKRPLAPATMRRIQLGIERYGPTLLAAAGNTWEAPGSSYVRAWPVTDPAQTQTCTAQHAVAVPPGAFLVQPAHQGADGCRIRDVGEPHPTICASDDRMALVVPFRNNGRARPASDAPLSTISAGGFHHGLVMAPQSGGRAMPTSNPAPSVVTKVPSMLVTYNRTGQARPVTEPASTVTTKERHALVLPELDINDCLFRMLEPFESGRAMAFPDDYRVEGTKKDVQRLYGNAVTPPIMATIVRRLVEAFG